MKILERSQYTKRLKVGDIFFGDAEFIIGRRKSKDSTVVEVGVTEKQCFKKDWIVETFYSKGKLFTNQRQKEFDFSMVDKSRKNSTWIVEFVEHREKLRLIHSTMPESYLIRARKLKGSKIDPDGEVIEFYTCGNSDNVINVELEVFAKLD